MLEIVRILMDYEKDPAGVEEMPQFNWELKSDKRGVVQKAYQLLEHDGYICSVPGKGSFLCDLGGEASKKKREAEQALKTAVRDALENAVSPEEIRALVERILTGGEAS